MHQLHTLLKSKASNEKLLSYINIVFVALMLLLLGVAVFDMVKGVLQIQSDNNNIHLLAISHRRLADFQYVLSDMRDVYLMQNSYSTTS